MKFFKKRPAKKPRPLKASSLTFSYENTGILQDISLELKSGEIVSIIGNSGCGKSTLLKIIAGIIPLNKSGKIKIFGINRAFKKSSIGFAPQDPALIPDLSIEDNIKIFSLNSGIPESTGIKNAKKLLKMLHLEEDIKKFPTSLSGGQLMRLNIILSLLHDPKIIILDEPFNGLDFKNRRLLWHFLKSLKKQGKSIILTSHLLTETQEHVDRLILIKNRKIFFKGNLESLKRKLKIQYIYELRMKHLSEQNLEKIKKYCVYKDLKILDYYKRYIMFGINTTREKLYLIKFLEKLNLPFEEISFREPNLDETFLKA